MEMMVERMESQMKSMQSAYDFELKEVEVRFLTSLPGYRLSLSVVLASKINC